MQTTYWAISILLVLDIGIVVLGCQLDKRLYGRIGWPFLAGDFFLNSNYDEPVNRLLLSKGGMMVMSLIFMATILLTSFTHGAV